MTPTQFAALAIAWLLQASRLLQATKSAWGIIPPKYQWVPPFALTFVTELSVKLATGVHTWGDVALPVLIVISPLLPGARSNVHAAIDGTLSRLANDPTTPAFSVSGYQRITRGAATPSTAVMTLALGCVLAFAFGCSAVQKLTPAQDVDLSIKGTQLVCRRYLGQGQERDPALDELCRRLLGDAAPTITADTTPDAGSSAGGKSATGDGQ
jgi:hypothetical protein